MCIIANEANNIHLNTGIRPKSLDVLPVNIVLHGGKTKSLWDCNY